jgi:hypothetical protein
LRRGGAGRLQASFHNLHGFGLIYSLVPFVFSAEGNANPGMPGAAVHDLGCAP